VSDSFVVTCEHGGNRIPEPYRASFGGRAALLATHRGYDPGALTMARQLAAAFAAPLVASTISRLLVDLNRSLGHPKVFSDAARALPQRARADIVERHYFPYRRRVEAIVSESVAGGCRVVHLSSHSFTPELDGDVRRADVGLLYDPRRAGEAELCAHWKAALAQRAPALRVRRNYPYAGKGDGLTAHLRKRFPSAAYVGIELEINQAIVFAGGRRWTALRSVLIDALHTALAA